MKTNHNITQEQLETIEQFLNNNLETEERTRFEAQMDSDPDFNQLVNDVRTMIIGVESASLKEKLDSFHEDIIPVKNLEAEVSNKSTPKLRNRIFQISVAASVILALGLFYFFNQDSTSEKLFAKHFTADPGLPTTMSTSENFTFYDAMVNYKRAEYNTAIKKWETLLVDKPKNDTLNFFLGVSYLAERNGEKASQLLSETLNYPESIFIEDAYYFAALAELQKDNIEEAKSLLQKIDTEKSRLLLNDLNK